MRGLFRRVVLVAATSCCLAMPARAYAQASPASPSMDLPVRMPSPPDPAQGVAPAESVGPGEAIDQPAVSAPPNTDGEPIDLNTALRLAGVQNPELNAARQRVIESVALRQLAAAQILPTLNFGGNYDSHTGVLQQSNGNILSVNRSALYVGSGANAVAAGTVNIPGVLLSGNLGTGIFAYLASRQQVRVREFDATALRNQVFLEVTRTYTELLQAEGWRAITAQARDEATRIADLTSSYARIGEGRLADADRAAAEQAQREADLQQAEGDVRAASARLAQVLNLDASIQLRPTDASIVPLPIVPDPIAVRELIAIGMLQRPELAARRAAIRESLLMLESAKILPFSPNALIGFSGGGFGGGSNLLRPVFGGFGGRSDLDIVAYWSIQNMGVGNIALIRIAKARLQASKFEELTVLNRVRAEVAEAYAVTHARFAQIGATEAAVRAGRSAFERDFSRIRERAVERGSEVLPIELLNSFRLLARSRRAYLDAIIEYNQAQFALYVALGQPPANMLARPVPTEGIAPTIPNANANANANPAGVGAPGPFAAPAAAVNPGRGSAPGAVAASPAVAARLAVGVDPSVGQTSNPR